MEQSAHHYYTVINTVMATLAMVVLAFGMMLLLKRRFPNYPALLSAVLVTSLFSTRKE